MSDDISIPRVSMQGGAMHAQSFTHSYRTRRSRRGGGGTQLLLLVAVGLGVLLLGGMMIWSMMGHRSTVIPVVEADPRPIRVKPTDPGGMQVVGANVEMGGASASGDGTMAPAPEAPAPQALRAQMQLPAGPPPTPVQAALTIPAPAAPAPAPAAAAPVVAAPAVTAPSAPARPAGGMFVQLAALGSEQAAQTAWQGLAKRMPDLFQARQAVVQRAEKDGRPIWRLRTGGFGDIAEATGFCGKVRAKGADCSLASF